jgi:hypothetical protein
MRLQKAASSTCDRCTEVLEAQLLQQKQLGGRLTRLFGAHVLAFPEGEYILRTQRQSGHGHCELVISASVRADPPRLDTWCTSWTVPGDTHLDVAGFVTAEIQRARQRFLAMLQEHREPVPS